MEAYRHLNPNGFSISTVEPPGVTNSPFEQYAYAMTSHADTGNWGLHWTDPTAFDPDRYLTVPTAAQNGQSVSDAIGFASCPFEQESYSVEGADDDITIANSVFGTTYPVSDGMSAAICDYAGYAPFGFGYRRCPGELLNVQVVTDLLWVVWNQKLEFVDLHISDPKMLPVGPLAVEPDIYGFTQVGADEYMT